MPLNPFALNRSTKHLGRSTWAVLLGYIVSVIVVMVGFVLIQALWPQIVPDVAVGESPGPVILQVSLGLSLVAAVAAGFVTAKVSPNNPSKHIKILFAVMFVLSLVTIMAEGGIKPLWWHGAMILLMGVGLYGGLHLAIQKKR